MQIIVNSIIPYRPRPLRTHKCVHFQMIISEREGGVIFLSGEPIMKTGASDPSVQSLPQKAPFWGRSGVLILGLSFFVSDRRYSRRNAGGFLSGLMNDLSKEPNNIFYISWPELWGSRFMRTPVFAEVQFLNVTSSSRRRYHAVAMVTLWWPWYLPYPLPPSLPPSAWLWTMVSA